MSLSSALVIVWLIYGSVTVSESAGIVHSACNYRKICDTIEYDIREAICCDRHIHSGAGLSCCGGEAFNPAVATCCKVKHGNKYQVEITHGLSEMVSACCGLKAYNPLNEMCCNSTIVVKPVAKAQCCGNDAIDVDSYLCCGRNEEILRKTSNSSLCCGDVQYDSETQCCCNGEHLEIQNKTQSNCCKQCECVHRISSAVGGNMQTQKPTPQPICNGKNISLCGSSCYNHSKFQCCERKETTPNWCCNPGLCDASPTVYDPSTQVCCDGCVSTKPWMHKCCGLTAYGLAQRRVLCCHNTMYLDKEDGEEYSEISIPYDPAKGTVCSSQFHALPDQHCCGREIYRPETNEICCDGHRHPKGKNSHCCGIQVYNIKDPRMKCCAGTLYNLTSLDKYGHDAQCCGSILQEDQKVCCSGDNKEVLYSPKNNFGCCGHRYVNTSLWSCFAGKLKPAKQAGSHQSKMIRGSLSSVNETQLCKEIRVGIVQSMSQHSIVFNYGVIIYGKNGTMKPLPSPYILKTGGRNSPEPIPGKPYFFDESDVYTDFNHDSVFKSLHFIISKC
ncbi:uncharacterized protein si:ch211-195m9.3 [Lates calcarifer]|uniref:Uncharacterized protein si:ch211-195m9.3 n=1 Tax=Lates calcarifer TaxID=8187 RepID=A0AAJ7VJT6_LATCA|nr:uncharacterized protein si:ch211-195m9.3 [Lates calcarifer]